MEGSLGSLVENCSSNTADYRRSPVTDQYSRSPITKGHVRSANATTGGTDTIIDSAVFQTGTSPTGKIGIGYHHASHPIGRQRRRHHVELPNSFREEELAGESYRGVLVSHVPRLARA